MAMLDAILSPEWERRYDSFNSQWADDEMMASMRNGSGDYWFALLTSARVALHGLAHEYPTFRRILPWPGIFDSLPREFHANFLKEPAFDTANSTFCIWRRASDDAWSCGAVQLPPGEDPDGSAWLLEMWPESRHSMSSLPLSTTNATSILRMWLRYTDTLRSPRRS